MFQEVLVNEPVNALVRLMSDGEIRPTSFLWRNKTRYVHEIGRQWEERLAGRNVRCYLIRTVDQDTYELHLDPTSNSWLLHRAWLRSLVV
jgi:hypothetical protein